MAGFSGGNVPSYLSSTFTQSASFGMWRPDASEFVVRDSAFNDQTGEWERTHHAFRASFDVEMVVGAEKNLFYLKGVAPDGEDVIQRWRLEPVVHGSPPRQALVARKTELYRGTSLGGIHTFGADPERRFLLLVHGSPKVLSKLSLTSGYSVTTVFTEAQIQHLRSSVSLIGPFQHGTLGRVWKVMGSPEGDRTLLFDPDNDGVFNGWQTYGEADYELRFPPKVWKDDFLNH